MHNAQKLLVNLQATIQADDVHIHSLEEQLHDKKDCEQQLETSQRRMEELQKEVEAKNKEMDKYDAYLDRNSERISSMEKEQLEQVSIIAQLKRMLSLRRDELNKVTDNE